MSWTVEYTKRFFRELARLPRDVQERVEIIVFKDLKSNNPFQLGYVEQMTGFPGKFKIRVGDYRIGIEIVKKEKIIICRRVCDRKDIYRRFP